MDGKSALESADSSLQGLHGLVLGLADEHSIAWGCLREAKARGAQLIATCFNEKAQVHVSPLATGLGIDLIACDVGKPGELAAAVAHAAQKLGRLDFVIHSIAWAPAADLNGLVMDSSCDGFSRAMAVSCHSFAALSKLCAPLMSAGGSLIAMTYLGSEKVVRHYGLMGPVKAALESLVRYLAVELGPRAIRVNAVSPGPIPTRAASGIEGFDDILDDARRKAPLGRLVTLEEIAQLTVFLCSPAGSGITGQTIHVDAGRHIVA